MARHYPQSDLAIERQKERDWAGAKRLWQAVQPEILRDVNLAICHSWLRDCAEALNLLKRYHPWPDPSEEMGMSDESVRMLHRALLVIELHASDSEGDIDHVSRCAEELAELGGELHELVRNPVALVLKEGQIDVFEDVVYVGDITIPLVLYSRSLRRKASKAAQRLASLYPKLERDSFEPMTTNRERLATAIGLPARGGPRAFTPSEWQTRVEGDHRSDNEEPEPNIRRLVPALGEPIDTFWLGFQDQLGEAFRSLAKEVTAPDRVESPADYARVYYMVKELASYLPLCRAVVRAGRSLYRARVVSHAACEDDISYVPDPKLVREFGRANAPEESVFYCADEASTAVAEVLNPWFEGARVGESRQVFVGRWLTTRDIEAAVVPYHEEALELSQVRADVRHALDQLRLDYAPASYKLVRDCLTYLGSEYARVARSSLDYWVSTAYFNFATNPHNFLESSGERVPEGLFYPSVQMKYHGDNFATFPYVVDSAMRLIDVQAMRFCCVHAGNFTLEGSPPTWFSKRGREFAF